jgi:diguanylate cyclase (GGDEF)-like protein
MLNSLVSRMRLSGAFLVIALIACAYALSSTGAVQRIDLMLYDYFLNWQKHQASDEIVIVAIDDASLQKLGRWPWSRRLHGRLLDRLAGMNAKVVGFDVLFSEQQHDDPLADKIFAEAIRRSGNTVLAVAPSNPFRDAPIAEVLPIPVLAESAAGLGHVDIEIDSDGLCRSFFLHAGIGDAHWPTFTLAMLKAAGETGSLQQLRTDSAHEEPPAHGWLRRDRFLIPFDPSPDALQTVSVHEVLSNDAVGSRIAGKYVLVGSTATGLGDVISTPVSLDHQRMPGVELNAHVLSGLLRGGLATQMSAGQYQALTLTITGIAAVWMVSTSFPAAIVLFLVTVAGILTLAATILFVSQLWFPPAAAIAPLIIGFPIWGAWSLLLEKRINRSLTVRMQHQALHHLVTDLPNQYVLEERLRALSDADGVDREIAALIIVHLKWSGSAGGIVGRAAGDELLGAIGQRLRNAVRSDDLVVHLSGDDFGILITQLGDSEQALRIAQNLLYVLREPLDIGDSPIALAPRMGMSIWPKDSPDTTALLRDAYIAMFRARIEQSNKTCVYSDEIAEEMHARSRLEQALLSAMERGEFEVYYQPQVVTGSGRIIGVEALLRWHNPELGLVYPGTFIPVAEHNGLIHEIGGWVLRAACEQVQQWNEQGLGPLRLAVNLSPLQFADDSLEIEVRNALELSGLDPHSLELEITESALMHNLEQATAAMRALKEQGVKLAIDDFGTGYSSLSNLQNFPLDRIKIDQSFTREIHNNKDVREITATIIMMAKRLKLETIAEGVETESQAIFLGKKGCDELQGYYFSHPLPASDLLALLDQTALRDSSAPQNSRATP